jgi:hypothetical protein
MLFAGYRTARKWLPSEEHEFRCGESLPKSGTKEIWEDLAVTRTGDAGFS